jgi:hypothetical protein
MKKTIVLALFGLSLLQAKGQSSEGLDISAPGKEIEKNFNQRG